MGSKSFGHLVIAVFSICCVSLGAHATCYSTKGAPDSCQISKEGVEEVIQGGVISEMMTNDLFREIESKNLPNSSEFLRLWHAGDFRIYFLGEALNLDPCLFALGLAVGEKERNDDESDDDDDSDDDSDDADDGDDAISYDRLMETMNTFIQGFKDTKSQSHFELAKLISDRFNQYGRSASESDSESDPAYDQMMENISKEVIPQFMSKKGLLCDADKDDL